LNQPLKGISAEEVFPDLNCLSASFPPEGDGDFGGIGADDVFYDVPVFKPFRFLLEVFLSFWKRKPFINFPNKTGMVYVSEFLQLIEIMTNF